MALGQENNQQDQEPEQKPRRQERGLCQEREPERWQDQRYQEQYKDLRDEIRKMILSRLNAGQRLAVETGDGPVLCLAGAGSGKTTAMVYRILHLLTFGPRYDRDCPPPVWAGQAELEYLILYLAGQGREGGDTALLSRQLLALIGQQGVPAYHLLAITFTNKAAQEMRQRLEALLGESLSDMWVMTFHSACLRILKREREHLVEMGYQADFSIYDSGDQEQVLRGIIKGLNLNDKEHPPKTYLRWISGEKSAMRLPPANYQAGGRRVEDLRPLVYARYQQSLLRNNAMDFDDLLLQTALLFRRWPDCLAKYQAKFQYIMVDEYQDTNHIQYQLISMLGKGRGNVCVVGDDDQSIYGFRQADIRNILDFERDFPGARVIRLEQNYRSTGRILAAANQLVAHNRERKKKTLWTEKEQGDKVCCYRASDDRDEARFICSRVQMTRERGGGFGDHAVLLRTNAQSRILEEWFGAFRIPYVIIGGLRFYERKEIKDILAYLKWLANPEDQVALRRIINVPRRGIGEATVNQIISHSVEAGLGLAAALGDREGLGLSSRAERAVADFRALFAELRRLAAAENVAGLTEQVLRRSGYWQMLQDEDSPESEDRLDNLREFSRKAKEFDDTEGGNLAEFLSGISLLTDMDLVGDEARAGAVQVMTMHMAKGLEFPQVFVAGMEEGIFPHFRSQSDQEIEEERRLCYVAMTRAKEKLYLSWAAYRSQYGREGRQRPSRFLAEVPASLKEESLVGQGAPAFSVGQGAPAFEEANDAGWAAGEAAAGSGGGDGRGAGDGAGADRVIAGGGGEIFRPGDKVSHKLWGPGSVVSAKGSGSSLTYIVAFPEKGLRTLQADIAPLKRLE
ncbi:MAG: UvrD-helicase domain-containing protein [Peptococcaceae bacterium]|jgi:DNA helicase-2/ATP-dependent DNA helicase PcrA|nr:UvrD-helicase domain-containing protein [Peptococcaceae bacterium]